VGATPTKDNLHLLEFISSVGGFTADADRRTVKVYRGPATKRQSYTVDVEEIMKTGDFFPDFSSRPATSSRSARARRASRCSATSAPPGTTITRKG